MGLAEDIAVSKTTRDAEKRHENDRRMSLHEDLWPILEAASWQMSPGTKGSGYFLALGPDVRISVFFDEFPLLSYSVTVNKKQSVLRLISPIMQCEGYLEENASILLQAIDRVPAGNVVLRLPGQGWDGEAHDWAASFGLIKRAIAALEPSMSSLLDDASQSLQAHLEKFPLDDETATVEGMTITIIGQSQPRKSFWQRLFGA